MLLNAVSSRSFATLVTLLWTHSNSGMSLYQGTHSCTQDLRWGSPVHCRAEQSPSWPVDGAVLDAPQDTSVSYGCQGTLLTHIQLATYLNNQMSFFGASLQSLIHQLQITRITLSQVEDLALALVKFHAVGDYHHSGLTTSLCKFSLPLREWTVPPILV